ncbi:helix-turn-helix domain-containing protein [Halobellus marinus]|uniref:helix-turn-helix domain-containing protein n=1 Tax=Halobellus TaxID=1073986 RepID=UPI0028A7E634|nr:helix-turn-helix domain-containing protein [Halobellus sp. DFY28]
MSETNSESAFTRRKFTITESLDAVLEEMAEQNYQGNVSLCLRAAIEDHKQTLDGTDSGLMTQQLANRINDIEVQQNRVLDTLNEIESHLDQQQTQSGTSKFDSNDLPGEAERILNELESAESGLRVDGLAERLGLPTSRVQPVLSSLLDYGLVAANDSAPGRYYLMGLTEDNRRS